MTDLVRASGCVVFRRVTGSSGMELLVVHRPRYDDWSFPKGKRDPGETDEECAVRELEEETGLRAELGDELEPVTYVDHKGRDKIVRYWAVEVGGAGPDPVPDFVPNEEVDQLVWLDPLEAHRHLSYIHDHDLVHQVHQLYRS